MTVSDHLKSTHSYFVRVKGSDANAVAESFKANQIVDAGIADEFGLITAEWAEMNLMRCAKTIQLSV